MPRVSRDQVSENRTRILQVAGKLFRERGFKNVGVADVMAGAGLTHGGFYGHFKSKEDLVAQTCQFGLTIDPWAEIIQKSPHNALEKIAASYLTKEHCENPGSGCLLATLGSDISRQPQPVRIAFTQRIRARLKTLALAMPGKSSSQRSDQAMTALATMVGTMMLARAVDDPELAARFLKAGKASVRKLV